MLKKVRIQIITDRYEVEGSLYDLPAGQYLPEDAPAKEEPQHLEITVEGRYHDDGTRISIGYKESELTGMEGSSTTVSFQKNEPQRISMLRTGNVKTALVFEKARRHLCIYQTPIMPFDVCVFTRSVDNRIESDGILQMDYTVELRGAQSERTKFRMHILPDFDRPTKI